MPMLDNPSHKYEPYKPVLLRDRRWPQRVQKKAPIWVSTDLRDGNQALQTPMTVDQKVEFFKHLVECGFKEIEISFPAASEAEFLFTRKLIEEQIIPDDVWIQVMTPARREYIQRTFEAIRGADKVLIQLYNATGIPFREIVYRYSKEDIIKLAIEHTAVVRDLAQSFERAGGSVKLVYGVEGFSQTEPDFAIEVCSHVKKTWEEKRRHVPIVFNLASTVECGPANHFADQVEYFCRNIPDRSNVIVSVHTHNDRGTAVAATELAMLAGADRVDVCLLGNGERSGNVDGITLALNLYTQGISPGLRFDCLQHVVDLVTSITQIPVHPRHPYVGNLIYTAFSGAHQDGIAKGFSHMEKRQKSIKPPHSYRWVMPYLPVDPGDFGFAYEHIRVNSLSGKGGSAYIIHESLGLELPRPLQVHFYQCVQTICEKESRVEQADAHNRPTPVRLLALKDLKTDPPSLGDYAVELEVLGRHIRLHIAANEDVLKVLVQSVEGCNLLFNEHHLPTNAEKAHQNFVQLGDSTDSAWGAGLGESKVESAVKAFVCAATNLLRS